MSNPMENPFVKEQLTPRNKEGQSTATYELTKASVSPARITGRDSRGMPVLDTLPTVFWRAFLMLDGCINKVPMRTGSVPSMTSEALKYEEETYYDLIVAGCIPAWLCPFSTKWAHLTGGSFAEIPHGERDCGGSTREGGCDHLQHIAKLRKDKVREDYLAEKKADAAAANAKYDEMRRELVLGIGSAVGEAMAAHLVPQDPRARAAAAKQRIRDGKSDPGEVEEQ